MQVRIRIGPRVRRVARLLLPVAAVASAVVACAPPHGDATNPAGHRYVVPVAAGVGVSYGGAGSHHDYPAADVFATTSCGTTIVSPVDGTLLEVRREDAYVPAVDNPALRGGRSVTIQGADGVRYYLAHFEAIAGGLTPGQPVTSGQPLGAMGRSGRAGACHVHLGLSPPCPTKEWAVRRGEIWPQPYLDAWRNGVGRSPAPEVETWAAAHPGACALAAADPHAPDS